MKKVLSLVLAVMMVVGMTTVAFAAGDQDATHYAVSLGKSGTNLQVLGSDDAEFFNIDKTPDNDDRVDTNIYLFYDKDGNGNWVPITKSMNLKLDVTLKKSSGSSALDNASIKYESGSAGQAYIRLRYAEYLVATKEVEYKATMTLSSDSKRVRDGSGTANIVVEGEYENESQEVYEDDDKLWIEDANVLEGEEYNRALEIVMNDDVSLVARIFAGKKYYAAIEEEPDDAAITLMNAHSSIVNYVEFKTIGLSSSDVKFGYSDNMYAYTIDDDGNLVYVGRTNATLPYYSKYFISTRELDVTSATPDVDEPEPEPDDGTDGGTQTADGGGDDIAPSPENNYNPGTGRK